MAEQKRPAWLVLATHLANSCLRATFAIGFCILFAFIGHLRQFRARPATNITWDDDGGGLFILSSPHSFSQPLLLGKWRLDPGQSP
jgi:hypothetical protein